MYLSAISFLLLTSFLGCSKEADVRPKSVVQEPSRFSQASAPVIEDEPIVAGKEGLEEIVDLRQAEQSFQARVDDESGAADPLKEMFSIAVEIGIAEESEWETDEWIGKAMATGLFWTSKARWNSSSVHGPGTKAHWNNSFSSKPGTKAYWRNAFLSKPGTKEYWNSIFTEKIGTKEYWNSFFIEKIGTRAYWNSSFVSKPGTKKFWKGAFSEGPGSKKFWAGQSTTWNPPEDYHWLKK